MRSAGGAFWHLSSNYNYYFTVHLCISFSFPFSSVHQKWAPRCCEWKWVFSGDVTAADCATMGPLNGPRPLFHIIIFFAWYWTTSRFDCSRCRPTPDGNYYIHTFIPRTILCRENIWFNSLVNCFFFQKKKGMFLGWKLKLKEKAKLKIILQVTCIQYIVNESRLFYFFFLSTIQHANCKLKSSEKLKK